MPSSLIHLCVAKKVKNDIKVKEQEFLYGNILPDWFLQKNYKKKDKLHFYEKTKIGNIEKYNVDLEKFLQQHEKNIIDSVGLGVYSHFITDNLWIENFIIKHLIKIDKNLYIKTKRGNIRSNRKTIYAEYDRMAKWIVNRYNLSSDFIMQVNYDGIFKEIYNLPQNEIYEIINKYMSIERNEEMEIFSKQEVEDFIENASKKVINKLKLINISDI